MRDEDVIGDDNSYLEVRDNAPVIGCSNKRVKKEAATMSRKERDCGAI
jgi:hypothetical protein